MLLRNFPTAIFAKIPELFGGVTKVITDPKRSADGIDLLNLECYGSVVYITARNTEGGVVSSMAAVVNEDGSFTAPDEVDAEEMVRHLREAGLTQKRITEILMVSQANIANICRKIKEKDNDTHY